MVQRQQRLSSHLRNELFCERQPQQLHLELLSTRRAGAATTFSNASATSTPIQDEDRRCEHQLLGQSSLRFLRRRCQTSLQKLVRMFPIRNAGIQATANDARPDLDATKEHLKSVYTKAISRDFAKITTKENSDTVQKIMPNTTLFLVQGNTCIRVIEIGSGLDLIATDIARWCGSRETVLHM